MSDNNNRNITEPQLKELMNRGIVTVVGLGTTNKFNNDKPWTIEDLKRYHIATSIGTNEEWADILEDEKNASNSDNTEEQNVSNEGENTNEQPASNEPENIEEPETSEE